jgi:hypothetical protein
MRSDLVFDLVVSSEFRLRLYHLFEMLGVVWLQSLNKELKELLIFHFISLFFTYHQKNFADHTWITIASPENI